MGTCLLLFVQDMVFFARYEALKLTKVGGSAVCTGMQGVGRTSLAVFFSLSCEFVQRVSFAVSTCCVLVESHVVFFFFFATFD